MIRVLLVEDDDDFRSLIAESLPGYRVIGAASYEQALDLLRRGAPYDVAIVDLNLMKGKLDQLGKDLLGEMQAEYPWIPRIALTGEALGAVRGLMDQYGLADLLLKNEMTLAEARRVLRRVLESVAAELSLALRAGRGDLWDDFSEWQDSVLSRLDQKARTLEMDLRDAGRASALGGDVAGALEALKASKTAFAGDCSAVTITLAKIRNEADLQAVAVGIAALRAKYDGAF